MAYPPLPKREWGPSIAEGLPRNLKFSESLATTYKKKKLTPTKNIFVGGAFFFPGDSYSLFFYTGSFQVPLEKNHPHLRYLFPLKIPICPKSLLYKPQKWLNSQFPRGRVQTMNFTIFNSSLIKHLRWSSLCQKLANEWRLLTVVTKSIILKVTGLLYPTLQRTDEFGDR